MNILVQCFIVTGIKTHDSKADLILSFAMCCCVAGVAVLEGPTQCVVVLQG